jgi:hypothetical protein
VRIRKNISQTYRQAPSKILRLHPIASFLASRFLRSQVNYYWYKRIKAEHPDGPVGGYTRVLHCGRPDDICHLVPTLVVDPLPFGIDRGYAPMHRPWALSQFLSRMHIPEDYIMMMEPDHILVSPPPLLATPFAPAAYPFGYVDCLWKDNVAHCKKPAFNERQVPLERIAHVRAACTCMYVCATC